MYSVEFTDKCEKELRQQLKTGELTVDELDVIRAWVQEMEVLGPQYIENCGYWYDHALTGNRKGERSSSFSTSGRIIYKIHRNKIVIKVLKITPTHEY